MHPSSRTDLHVGCVGCMSGVQEPTAQSDAHDEFTGAAAAASVKDVSANADGIMYEQSKVLPPPHQWRM